MSNGPFPHPICVTSLPSLVLSPFPGCLLGSGHVDCTSELGCSMQAQPGFPMWLGCCVLPVVLSVSSLHSLDPESRLLVFLWRGPWGTQLSFQQSLSNSLPTFQSLPGKTLHLKSSDFSHKPRSHALEARLENFWKQAGHSSCLLFLLSSIEEARKIKSQWNPLANAYLLGHAAKPALNKN